MTHIASVGPAFSNYNDKLWSWLNAQKYFLRPAEQPEDPYDYILSWGYLLAAGCKFDPPAEYEDQIDEYWDIGFDGSVDELIARLELLIDGIYP